MSSTSEATLPPGFEVVLVSDDLEEARLLNETVVLLEGVILTTVSVLGLVGTLMSIYVLLKPRLKDCFSTLLTGLAVCDSAFLLLAVLNFGLPSLWTW